MRTDKIKDKIKKLLFSIFAYSLMNHAQAVAPGFYLGLMAGPATNGGSNLPAQTQNPPPATVMATPRSTQFGSSAYMGYKFNPYAGLEMGIQYFSGIQYDTKNVLACSGTNVRVRDIDVVGKGELPFRDIFDVFAKAGVAFTYITTSGALNPDVSQECGRSNYQSRVRPTATIGVDYNVNQNFVIDASWTRIMVGSVVSNVDFYALGFSYHFVNEYCGQFLCN